MKKLLFVATFLIISLLPLQAEFDFAPYTRENPATLTNEVFYPEFLQETDPINFANIIGEFKHRYDFFVGLSPESRQKTCFSMQNRINKWLSKMREKPETVFCKWADNRLLFDEESPIFKTIRPAPWKPFEECRYSSYGELDGDGEVFCLFHGPDPLSKFYQAHEHQFTEARPFITAYDVTEILIFLPFIMVIPITWVIMKRFIAG